METHSSGSLSRNQITSRRDCQTIESHRKNLTLDVWLPPEVPDKPHQHVNIKSINMISQ